MHTFGILKRDLNSKTIPIMDTKGILKWDPNRILKYKMDPKRRTTLEPFWIPPKIPLLGSILSQIKWEPYATLFGSIVLLGEFMCECVCVCFATHTHTHTHTNTHTNTHTHRHTLTLHTYIHTHIHTQLRTHTPT